MKIKHWTIITLSGLGIYSGPFFFVSEVKEIDSIIKWIMFSGLLLLVAGVIGVLTSEE